MDTNKFDTFLHRYETALDQYIPSGLWTILRLDGIGFSKTTKNAGLKKPFDLDFHHAMVAVTKHLVQTSGFRVVYAYTMSDEISLLLHPEDDTYGRKLRKVLSCSAGQASAAMQRQMDDRCLRGVEDGGDQSRLLWPFDSRVSLLPNKHKVIDYFRWRQADATRNCINSYCYWKLRESGQSKTSATRQLEGLNFADKNELLHNKFDINFDTLPLWQRRGVGVYRSVYRKFQDGEGPPLTTPTLRYEASSTDLPKGDDYNHFLWRMISWGTSDDPAGQLVGQEQVWFESEMWPVLKGTAKEGKYVVTYQKRLDYFDTSGEAYEFALEKYGLKSCFLLIRVEEPKILQTVTHF